MKRRRMSPVRQTTEMRPAGKQEGLPAAVFRFYRDGFRQMRLGRTLWKIVLVKLFVLFVILRLFFFPNFLQTHFDTDQKRADHVADQLIRPVHGTNH